MRKGIVMLAIITCFMCFFSGCIHPEGLLVTDQAAADEYMTDNPLLIEKYGEDYTFVLTGGGGLGEINRRGQSGEMSFDYLINGEDTYTISLKKEKKKAWEVQGIVQVACRYACDEINFSFDLNLESVEDTANGKISRKGDQVEVLASLGADYFRVEDTNSLNIYYRGWSKYSEKHMDDDEVDWDTIDKWEEQYKACTLLFCKVESNFDEFTAIVEPQYQDYLGSELKILHFHVVD